MYDLPKRFNVGMMSSKFAGDDSSPLTAGSLPVWPRYPGLHQQHSVEYWMMASLLYENGTVDEGGEAVRVLNPESADVFFVPFFSSLSFNTHGKNMTDPDTEFDRQLQVRIIWGFISLHFDDELHNVKSRTRFLVMLHFTFRIIRSKNSFLAHNLKVCDTKLLIMVNYMDGNMDRKMVFCI